MILCIDIGNSGIKCGALSADATISREHLPTSRAADAADLDGMVKRVASVALDFRAAIVSSVVPGATDAVSAAVFQAIALRPLEVSPDLLLPVELAVPVPSRVGTDRLCAAAGAIGKGGRDAIVVDAGSAITVDLVREGRYLGGVILPGPRVALLALHEHASQLPRIDYVDAADPFPVNFDATEPSMVLGASLGALGGILEAVRLLEQSAGPVSRHILTGGLAATLAPRLPSTWLHEPDLVLRGLYRIAELNLPA